MRADEQLTAKKYRCDAHYLVSSGIPEDENAFWKMVSWCTADIANANLPFASQLASNLTSIAHIDMCRLVENSYALMFYAQTGLPDRLDVVSAFHMLFSKMKLAWPEIEQLMDHTREIVMAIREWKPTEAEFAFLLALIFCNAVPAERLLMPGTMAQLENLNRMVLSAAQAHLCKNHGARVAAIRLQQLQLIIKSVIRQREARRFALSQFTERYPQLARQTVQPVVELVCEKFKRQWDYDYFQPVHYDPNQKRGVDVITDNIMSSV